MPFVREASISSPTRPMESGLPTSQHRKLDQASNILKRAGTVLGRVRRKEKTQSRTNNGESNSSDMQEQTPDVSEKAEDVGGYRSEVDSMEGANLQNCDIASPTTPCMSASDRNKAMSTLFRKNGELDKSTTPRCITQVLSNRTFGVEDGFKKVGGLNPEEQVGKVRSAGTSEEPNSPQNVGGFRNMYPLRTSLAPPSLGKHKFKQPGSASWPSDVCPVLVTPRSCDNGVLLVSDDTTSDLEDTANPVSLGLAALSWSVRRKRKEANVAIKDCEAVPWGVASTDSRDLGRESSSQAESTQVIRSLRQLSHRRKIRNDSVLKPPSIFGEQADKQSFGSSHARTHSMVDLSQSDEASSRGAQSQEHVELGRSAESYHSDEDDEDIPSDAATMRKRISLATDPFIDFSCNAPNKANKRGPYTQIDSPKSNSVRSALPDSGEVFVTDAGVVDTRTRKSQGVTQLIDFRFKASEKPNRGGAGLPPASLRNNTLSSATAVVNKSKADADRYTSNVLHTSEYGSACDTQLSKAAKETAATHTSTGKALHDGWLGRDSSGGRAPSGQVGPENGSIQGLEATGQGVTQEYEDCDCITYVETSFDSADKD
jgi:hypothetical protein